MCSLREGFGFIRCVEREQTMFFHFAEVLRLGQDLTVGDEVNMSPKSTIVKLVRIVELYFQYSTFKREH